MKKILSALRGLSFLMSGLWMFGKILFEREHLAKNIMSAPTAGQIETLLNFLEEHRELARGLLRSVEGRVRSQQLWENITTTLNTMGGCSKTMKQWQKVWTDEKYLAKKAAAASRRSANASGGGPSNASQLSNWELKVISIMGGGFGGPPTTARVPAFDEQSQELSSEQNIALALQPQQADIPQLCDPLPIDEGQPSGAAPPQQGTANTSNTPAAQNENTSGRHQGTRRTSAHRIDGSVRDRLFRLEESRADREREKNEHLAHMALSLSDILTTLREMCALLRQQRNN